MNNELIQTLMEQMYNRRFIRTKVRDDLMNSDFGNAISLGCSAIQEYLDGEYYESKQLRVKAISDRGAEDLMLDTLTAVCLSLDPQPIQSAAARLSHILEIHDPFDSCKTAAELIAIGTVSNLYQMIKPKDSGTQSLMVKSKVLLDHNVLAHIERSKYLPPMVVVPNQVYDTMDCSHLTFTDSLILGHINHHKWPVAVDTINISNGIALSLDEDILQYEETSNKPLDTPEKLGQFQKLRDDSVAVYNEILEAGNKFWFTWKYDSRGRQYCSGYHISIQSTCYKKACISLNKKELITGV